jgi:hypothetical protein
MTSLAAARSAFIASIVVSIVVSAILNGVVHAADGQQQGLRICTRVDVSSDSSTAACVGIDGSATTTRYNNMKSHTVMTGARAATSGEQQDCTCLLTRTLCEQVDARMGIHTCAVQGATCAAQSTSPSNTTAEHLQPQTVKERLLPLCLFPLCHLFCTTSECHYGGELSKCGFDSDLCSACFAHCEGSPTASASPDDGATSAPDPKVCMYSVN